VVGAPLVAALILSTGTGWGLVALWLLLSATDGADGFVARRQGTTRSGAFLDPLADKIIVLAAMAALVSINRMWWVPVALIGVREVAISAYRSYVGRHGISVPARPWAKVKTGVQDVAVAMALAPIAGDSYGRTVGAVLSLAVVLTLVTGAQYLWDGRRVIRAV
jgi:CDP-diacylglycerol--glycerol-3-phosphate 3-phosphatidyltransferase